MQVGQESRRQRSKRAETGPGTGRGCDVSGCPHTGDYRAPKGRDRLTEFFWFCLDHVRDYNRSWNFLKGLSQPEIESLIRNDVIGRNPTWPLGYCQLRERLVRERMARKGGFFGEDDLDGDKAAAGGSRAAGANPHGPRPHDNRNRGHGGHARGSEGGGGGDGTRARGGCSPAELEALLVLGLVPPLTLPGLKARYRELVKAHHPDAHGGDKRAEERLKRINLAYSTLKAIFSRDRS
ncbi:Molecular chaperone DnaJ [uncultured Gammaproteobacteria bacterium]